MLMQSRSSPDVDLPEILIVALAREAGRLALSKILVGTLTAPAFCGQLRPSQVMEPEFNGKLKVLDLQMSPLKVLWMMEALRSTVNEPPLTSSSTLPEPVTSVFCPRVIVFGVNPVTFPCLAPQSVKLSFMVPPCTNSSFRVAFGLTNLVIGPAVMESWYMQMPVMPPIISHLAPVGHPPRKHERAQYFLPLLWSWSRHFGLAVVPAGTSVGHAAVSQ